MLKIGFKLKHCLFYKSLLILVLFLNIKVYAEFSVGVFKLESKNINSQTHAVINNAIFNFIKEIKQYEIIDMRSNTSEINGKLDFIFTGAIIGHENGIELTLILKNQNDEVKKTISKIYGNANLILLDSRLLVNSLFDMSSSIENISDTNQKENDTVSTENKAVKVNSLEALSGSWHGEEGLERIEIMRGGRAIAVLSSGASIFLNLKLSGGYLIITQSVPLQARQFPNLPDNIAKKAAELGKPPLWKFLVSEDNKILLGEKTYLDIKYNADSIISAKEISEKVKWIKN